MWHNNKTMIIRKQNDSWKEASVNNLLKESPVFNKTRQKHGHKSNLNIYWNVYLPKSQICQLLIEY